MGADEHHDRDDDCGRTQPRDTLHHSGEPPRAVDHDPAEGLRIDQRHLVVPQDVLGETAEDPGSHRTNRKRERQREAPGTARVDPGAEPPDLARVAPANPDEQACVGRPGPEGAPPG